MASPATLQLDRDGRGFTARIPVPADAAVLKTNDNHKPTHIKFQIDYDIGGDTMFTGKIRKRGYRVRITPVEYRDYLEAQTLLAGFNVSGGYILLEEVKSFNLKRLQAWAAAAAPHVEEIVAAFLNDERATVIRLCEALKL